MKSHSTNFLLTSVNESVWVENLRVLEKLRIVVDVIDASGHHGTLRDRVGTWRSSNGIKAVLTVVLALKALLVDGNTPSEAPSLR